MMNHAVFGAVQTFDFFIGSFELFVDAGVFNRQRDQVCDGGQQFDVRLIKAALLFVDRTQHADHAAFDFQRHIRHVLCAIFDLSIDFAGIRSPNPFWLASAPPTNSGAQVMRAFEMGWGGAVWKTLATEPIVNVSSRYGAIDYDGRKVVGLMPHPERAQFFTQLPHWTHLKEEYIRKGKKLPKYTDGLKIFENGVKYFL